MIDLLVVRKDSLGNVMTTTASDLDFEEATAFGSYVGSLAGYKTGGDEGMDYGAIAGAAELADGHVFDETGSQPMAQSAADFERLQQLRVRLQAPLEREGLTRTELAVEIGIDQELVAFSERHCVPSRNEASTRVRARARRDMTVPIGICTMSAMVR